jgi:hypothetical protein
VYCTYINKVLSNEGKNIINMAEQGLSKYVAAFTAKPSKIDVEYEEALRKYIEEYRVKPSKVAAKLFLYSITNYSYFSCLETILYNWLDFYSEIDCSTVTTFYEVYDIMKSIRLLDEENVVETCRVFYLLRTKQKKLLGDTGCVMNMLSRNPSPKSLICQTFVSLISGSIIDLQKYFELALQENVVMITRSILLSFPIKYLTHLKNKLTEGHARSIYKCTCNSGKVKQQWQKIRKRILKPDWMLGKISSCKVLDSIAELENILRILSLSSLDTTAIYELHLKAKRYNHARHSYQKCKNSMNKEYPFEGN